MEPSPSEETMALSSLNAALIKRLKIAVATTIIRNKPSNLSAREYTENLGRRLRQKEEDWKGRIRLLEDELLKTKQELAVSRLEDAGVCVQFGDLSVDEATYLEDELLKMKQESAVSRLEDAGVCVQFGDLSVDEGKEENVENMDHEASLGEGAAGLDFLTPPCSSDDNYQNNRLETTLRTNALFLHGIAQLKSIPENTRTDINQTVLDTAVAAVQHVEHYMVENCHGPWNHGKLLKDAVKGIVGLFDNRSVGEYQNVLDACLRLVGRLLGSLVEHDGLNNNPYQLTLCQLLTMLGRVDQLQVSILHCILNHLKEASAMLRRTQQGKQDIDHVLFENTFYLCTIFEDVIFDRQSDHRSVGTDRRQFRSRLKEGVVVELHDGLEDCLLHVSKEFPLYAQFLWRLTGALECIQVE